MEVVKIKIDIEERNNIEKYAKQYNLETISVCRNCYEHWVDISYFKCVKICNNCKTGKYLTYYYNTYDVIEQLKK